MNRPTLEELMEKFRPKRQKTSVIRELAPQICALKRRGYTWPNIADVVNRWAAEEKLDLTFTAGYINQIMARYKPEMAAHHKPEETPGARSVDMSPIRKAMAETGAGSERAAAFGNVQQSGEAQKKRGTI